MVLIDGQSASASEIVSGTLAGPWTARSSSAWRAFGKGLVQQTKDMAFNTRLKVTVAKYYTASGTVHSALGLRGC